MVELGEPVEEFLSDDGIGIKLYSPHLGEWREVGYLFGIGLHLASVGRSPRSRSPNLWLTDCARHRDHRTSLDACRNRVLKPRRNASKSWTAGAQSAQMVIRPPAPTT